MSRTSKRGRSDRSQRVGYTLRSGTTGHSANTRSSFASSNVRKKEGSLHVPPLLDEEFVSDVHEEEEPIEAHATQGGDGEVNMEQSVSETTTIITKPTEHPTVFGKDVHGRILEEIVESFIVKRGREPPRIPLCRLMENEAIRAVGPGTEGLVKRFEMFGYSVLGAVMDTGIYTLICVCLEIMVAGLNSNSRIVHYIKR